MLSNCTDVILCKGISDNKNKDQDDYVKYLHSAGYNCIILTTLNFKFVNLNYLKECLLKPEFYDGLIFTSPRAVEAIHAAIEHLPDQWKKIPAYCVGPTTEALAKNNLNLEACKGSHCGNSKDLAQYIINNSNDQIDTTKPLLYPCSAIARDSIEKIFATHKIKLTKIIVYETLPAETLKDDLLKILKNTPQIFVFFSPSTHEYLTTAAHENSILLSNIIPIAIGPVTAEAISKTSKVFAIANKPEPQAVLEAVQKAEILID